MDFKGSKLIFPYYLLNILQKMASTVQSTIGKHDYILFHHVLVKILVQHQLSLIGKDWDQFLNENVFYPE